MTATAISTSQSLWTSRKGQRSHTGQWGYYSSSRWGGTSSTEIPDVAADMSDTGDSAGLLTRTGGKIYPTWQEGADGDAWCLGKYDSYTTGGRSCRNDVSYFQWSDATCIMLIMEHI